MTLTVLWFAVLAGVGCWVTWSDLRTHTIPHGGLLASLILLGSLQGLRGQALPALTGGSLTVLIGWFLWRFTRGFGGGDGKYWMVLGVALGPVGAFWTLALAALGALVWGLVSGDWNRRGAHATIAFGPWLAGASVGVAFVRLVSG